MYPLVTIIIGLLAFTNAQMDMENVKLIFVTGTTPSQNITHSLPQSLNLLNEPSFDKNVETIFYIHGFTETMKDESIMVVTDAHRQNRPTSNFVIIDWSYYDSGNYIFEVLPRVKELTPPIAAEIKKLIDNGLNLNLMHLIGHSLGGQMVGFVGRELQKSNIMVKRITALDPALPGFFPQPIFDCIKATDAEFVDVIHTNAALYGNPATIGTVDFWPNSGFVQPGCPFAMILSLESFCSHWKSWRYYAESLYYPYNFPAVKSLSFFTFLFESKLPNQDKSFVYMGVNVNKTATGSYYLTTNPQSPYGKGVNGTTW